MPLPGERRGRVMTARGRGPVSLTARAGDGVARRRRAQACARHWHRHGPGRAPTNCFCRCTLVLLPASASASAALPPPILPPSLPPRRDAGRWLGWPWPLPPPSPCMSAPPRASRHVDRRMLVGVCCSYSCGLQPCTASVGNRPGGGLVSFSMANLAHMAVARVPLQLPETRSIGC